MKKTLIEEMIDFFVEIKVDKRMENAIVNADATYLSTIVDLVDWITKYALDAQKDIPDEIRNILIHNVNNYNPKDIACIKIALTSAVAKNQLKMEA